MKSEWRFGWVNGISDYSNVYGCLNRGLSSSTYL